MRFGSRATTVAAVGWSNSKGYLRDSDDRPGVVVSVATAGDLLARPAV